MSIYKSLNVVLAWGSEINDTASPLGVCGVLVSTLGVDDQMPLSIWGKRGTTDTPFSPVGRPKWVVLRAAPSGCDQNCVVGVSGVPTNPVPTLHQIP